MSRGFSPISRISDEGAGYQKESYDLSPWMQRVMDQATRQTAVQQARSRQSIVNDINGIIAHPPRYATVDDAVDDMRERTGLNSYLQTIRANESKDKIKQIVASIQESDVKIPDSLAKYNFDEDLINYINNTIDNSHGISVKVPQLQHDILHTFGYSKRLEAQDVWNDEVAEFLSKLVENAREVSFQTSDSRIGDGVGRTEDMDLNSEYFAGLQPATV
jgi:hypothetical protein